MGKNKSRKRNTNRKQITRQKVAQRNSSRRTTSKHSDPKKSQIDGNVVLTSNASAQPDSDLQPDSNFRAQSGKLRSLWNRVTNKCSSENRAGLASVLWMVISFGSMLVAKLGSNLVLTRLLAPEAFGLMGTAMAFFTTLEWLSDMGIQPALIRHKHGSRSDYLSTGWWLGLFRGFGLTGIAALIAIPLVDFYEQPELLGVLLVLALRPALMSLRSPAMPTLRRNLNYRNVFIDEFGQVLVASIVSVILACFIPSVWAIVIGTMSGVVVGIVLSYALCPMKVGKYNRAASKEICGFGRTVLLNTLVMALLLNMDRLLGLKFVSALEMGLYAIAFNLAAVLEGLITKACDVHFSMLSRLPNQEKQNEFQRRITSKVTKWMMPLLAVGVMLGPFVINLLYDERYTGAGIILSIFIARQMIRGIGQLQFQLLLARGEVNRATVAYGVALVVQAVMFVPMIQAFGVCGLAVCGLVSTTVLTGVQALLTHQAVRQQCDVMRPVIATACWMCVAIPLLSMQF
jgi:O-antigen/teichoic acid export membrane protein